MLNNLSQARSFSRGFAGDAVEELPFPPPPPPVVELLAGLATGVAELFFNGDCDAPLEVVAE